MARNIDILAVEHAGGSETGGKWKALQVGKPCRDLEDDGSEIVWQENGSESGRGQITLMFALEAKQSRLASGDLEDGAARCTQISGVCILHGDTRGELRTIRLNCRVHVD